MLSKYDITMVQGSTFDLEIIWQEPNKTPKDLTGYTARMQIRRTYESKDITEVLTTESGEITIDASNGIINMVLSAERTAEIKVDYSSARPGTVPSSVYVYDLEMESPSNEVVKLIFGNVTVFAEVTR